MPSRPKRAPRRSVSAVERHLNTAVERNIKALLEVRRQMERERTIQDRIADIITRFSGSTLFLYLHIVWFIVWIALNLDFVKAYDIKPFDPYPYGLLTMIVSLEAIFLSTFVLISQQRLSEIQDDRADLDVQIDLLAEYEITKILRLTDAIARKVGVHDGKEKDLAELKTEIKPESLLEEIGKRKRFLGIE